METRSCSLSVADAEHLPHSDIHLLHGKITLISGLAFGASPAAACQQ